MCLPFNQFTTIMNKNYLTVREIRDYADKLREQGLSGLPLQEKVADYVYQNTHPNFEIGNVCLEDDYDHTYIPDLDERGYPVLKAYNDSDGSHAEDLDMEIPVTRGFSDVPDTKDTSFTQLDVTCACEMLRNRKVYPWMLQQVASADDLGIEEAEYEEILEDICGM